MYKNNDWEMASKRLDAFWSKEVIDRPCLQIYASAPSSTQIANDADNIAADIYWTDPNVFFKANQRHIENTAFMGEAFASIYPNAEHVVLAMGAELEYSEHTVWIKKSLCDIYELDFSHVTIDNPVVIQMIEYFKCICEAAGNDCFISFPHMGNPGDTLARMRGYETLCLDLMDEPDRCFELEEQILRIWLMLHDLLYNTINKYMKGSCGWLPAWHPNRSTLIEFDFCALISPEIFKRYIPFLLERAHNSSHAIFHLDGPDALVHLDTILSISEFSFIQWEPGAGGGDILDWIGLMQKIQAANKGLYVSGGPHPIWKTEILLRELRPEGLLIPVRANSISEGEELLKKVSLI